jgi:hypothetical protein
MTNTSNSKGKTTGLHKQYFNGSPAHIGPKLAPSPKAPPKPAMKAPKGY